MNAGRILQERYSPSDISAIEELKYDMLMTILTRSSVWVEYLLL